MQAIKETASNIAASAVSGLEKTKATVQEKIEIMSAQHPMEKQMATQKKEERIAHAERTKLEAQKQNALTRQLSLSGTSSGNSPTKITARSQSFAARTTTETHKDRLETTAAGAAEPTSSKKTEAAATDDK